MEANKFFQLISQFYISFGNLAQYAFIRYIYFLPKISCSIQTAYERHRRDERVAEYSFGAGPEIIENIDKRSSNKNDNEIVRCTMYLQ